MKAVIVEDEINVREGFIKMLDVFCPEVRIVGTADSVKTATEVIHNLELDVLFLDINLPDGSGFDLLHSLIEYDFKVIFVTAYSQYAISAFKMSAVDYLLKPVSPDLLQKAISKVSSLMTNNDIDGLSILRENLSVQPDTKKKIVLRDLDNLYLIELHKIIYCHADGCYTKFVLDDNSSIITSTNLKEYEDMLDSYGFVRCHHSFLVNLDHIARMSKVDGATLVLSQGTEIPISKRKKSLILDRINNTFIN